LTYDSCGQQPVQQPISPIKHRNGPSITVLDALLSVIYHFMTVSHCCIQVLDEIRPYLIGTGGGGLEHVGLDGPICKVRITGPAAKVRGVLWQCLPFWRCWELLQQYAYAACLCTGTYLPVVEPPVSAGLPTWRPRCERTYLLSVCDTMCWRLVAGHDCPGGGDAEAARADPQHSRSAAGQLIMDSPLKASCGDHASGSER
jgi:hypothetical protein